MRVDDRSALTKCDRLSWFPLRGHSLLKAIGQFSGLQMYSHRDSVGVGGQ